MNNFNKQIISTVIILLGVAGISCASFLDQYGSIIGTANVLGSEFYIGSAATETLLINEKSDNCGHFGIAGEYRTFKTEDLGGVNFGYVPKAEISVRAKVENTSTTTPQDLILSFGYYDTGDTLHYLCSGTVVVDNDLDDYVVNFQNCDYAPTNVKSFFYEFKKDADCLTCDYLISKCAGGFYTKIKLDK